MADDPGLIAVLGDVHGNTRWTIMRIRFIGAALKNEKRKIILQCGDFLPLYFVTKDNAATAWRFDRVWEYLYAVEDALAERDVTLMFIDGNHEDWEVLNALRKSWYDTIAGQIEADRMNTVHPVKVTEHIWWLPRGYRWEWHGRTWLAFGGAGSPNASLLTKGWNWWEDELITGEQVAAASKKHADVLICHDVPSGVHIQHEEPLRSWRQEDLDLAEVQRVKLQALADKIQPADILHGHHHRCYTKAVNMDYGPVQVTGLGSDGDPLNHLIVNTRTMMVYTPGEITGNPDV